MAVPLNKLNNTQNIYLMTSSADSAVFMRPSTRRYMPLVTGACLLPDVWILLADISRTEYLLPFDQKFFVFQPDTQKFKN